MLSEGGSFCMRSRGLQMLQGAQDFFGNALDFRQEASHLVFVVVVVGVDGFGAELVESRVRGAEIFKYRRAAVLRAPFARVPMTEAAGLMVDDVGGVEIF